MIGVEHSPLRYHFSGPALGFIGFLLFSLVDAGLKYMQMDHSLFTTMAVTQLSCTLAVLLYIILKNRPLRLLKPNRPWVVGIYAVLSTLDFVAFLYAVARLPLAPLFVIILTAPLFMLLLACFLLRETISRWQILSVGLGFSGIMLMLRPWDGLSQTQIGAYDLLAVLAAVVSLSCFCAKNILMRRYGGSEVGLVLNFWGAVMLSVIFVPLAGTGWADMSAVGWGLGILIGVMIAAAVSVLNHAFIIGPVAAVAPLHYSQMLWATLLGYMIWHEVPTAPVYLGAACICGGGALLAWSQRASGSGA